MQLFEYLKSALQTSAQTTPGPDEDRPVRLAAAVLMVELSRHHQTLQPGEIERIVGALRRTFMVEEEAARALLARAAVAADRSTDLYHYSELLRTRFSEPQRERLLESLWTVALADRALDHYEEQYIAKISALLAVPNVRHLAIKSRMVSHVEK